MYQHLSHHIANISNRIDLFYAFLWCTWHVLTQTEGEGNCLLFEIESGGL